MDNKAVLQILDHLGSEYSKKWTPEEKKQKIKTWTMILKDVTEAQGWHGLEKALKSPGEFMPSVGKFREMCLSGKGTASIEMDAHEAWGVVMKHLNAYVSPIFKDGAIAETIRKMGGWKRLCGMLTTEEPFRKKDFIDLYQIARRKEEKFFPMLRGIYEDDFKFIGFASREEEQKALEWAQRRIEQDNGILKMLMEGVNGKAI